MKKTAALALTLLLSGCTPLIPAARYSSVEVGDTYPEVLQKLGVAALDESGAPDPFELPGDPFWHEEMTYVYRAEVGSCEQTLRFQFKNYYDVEPNAHVHYDRMKLIGYNFWVSAECPPGVRPRSSGGT